MRLGAEEIKLGQARLGQVSNYSISCSSCGCYSVIVIGIDVSDGIIELYFTCSVLFIYLFVYYVIWQCQMNGSEEK